MKTNVRNHFLTSKQESRFNQLVVINQSFENDINYTSCGYLLSANAEIFYKVLQFIGSHGIDWEQIKKNVDLTSGQLPILQYAYDLFTNGNKYNKNRLTLTDLVYCDRNMVDAVLEAIKLFLDYEQDWQR